MIPSSPRPLTFTGRSARVFGRSRKSRPGTRGRGSARPGRPGQMGGLTAPQHPPPAPTGRFLGRGHSNSTTDGNRRRRSSACSGYRRTKSLTEGNSPRRHQAALGGEFLGDDDVQRVPAGYRSVARRRAIGLGTGYTGGLHRFLPGRRRLSLLCRRRGRPDNSRRGSIRRRGELNELIWNTLRQSRPPARRLGGRGAGPGQAFPVRPRRWHVPPLRRRRNPVRNPETPAGPICSLGSKMASRRRPVSSGPGSGRRRQPAVCPPPGRRSG